MANTSREMSAEAVAEEYDRLLKLVKKALVLCAAHRPEFEAHIAYKERLAREAYV